jgi:hypothetical protein
MGLFLLTVPGAYLITKNQKYAGRSWILADLWVVTTIYIILADGEFAKTVAAITTVATAGIISSVFILSGNLKVRAFGAEVEIASSRKERHEQNSN